MTLSWRSLFAVSRSPRWTIVTGSTNCGEEQPLLEPAVPAAEDEELGRALVERTVARRAEVDAGADQVVLALGAGPAVRRARRDQRGARVVVVAGRGLDVDLLAVVRTAVTETACSISTPYRLRLLHDPVGELGAADAVGEPGVVVEPLGHARLTAEALAVDHQRLEVLARGVDRRREPGRTAADR